jgi:tetratricopeptide (TPR) repeat protein
MALLDQALQQPAEEREGFLRGECRGDGELYQEVIEALYWEERMGSFLLEPLLDKATAIRPFAPGQVIAERFEILREIGEGGMGVVYEAHDRKRQQRVAIKAAKPGFQRMLSPELEGALKVRHHNICLVNEIHTEKTAHGEIDFLTMEFLEGETLSARLASVGKLDHKKALDIASQLCAGLAEAHQSDIVHRDLKSSNVLLCANEDGSCRVVIMDFGLATRTDLTAGESGGTPAYMAPELWQGEKATPASDIYALGVILYEMVAGRRPNQNEAEALGSDVERLSTSTLQRPPSHAEAPPASLMSVSQEAWHKHVTPAMPLPPSAWTKGLDARWNRVTMRCLATEPAERPQHAREVLDELTREPIPKWPFMSAGVVVLLLSAIFGFVKPARQWAADLIWPPNVRLAVLPYTGPKDLASVAGGALQDVAERVQQLSSGRRTVAVIPPRQLAEMKIETPEQARDVVNATHALEIQTHREPDGTIDVEGEIVDLKSQLKVKTLSARYSQTDLDRLQSALTGMVAMTFRLNETKSEDKLSAAATEPYLKGIYWLNEENDSYDKAMVKFQEAANLDPSSALPPSGMALALLQKFQVSRQNTFLEEAKRYLQTAQSRNPDSARVLLASGQVSEAAGQSVKALEDYKRIQELEPRSVDAQLGLASIYQALKEPEEALAAYRKAEELDPEYYKPYQMLGDLYGRLGRYEESLEQFRKMTEKAPGLAEAYAALAHPLLQLKRYAEAEQALQHALRIRETGQVLNNMGVIRYYQKRYSEAADYQIRALAYRPRSVTCLQNVGDNLRWAGRRSEATPYYRKGREQAELNLNANPQSAGIRTDFAYMCLRVGEKKRARQEIVQAMNMAPDDLDIRETAVVIYEALGERALAIDAFRQLTPPVRKDLIDHPDMTQFFQDPRVKQIMLEQGGN